MNLIDLTANVLLVQNYRKQKKQVLRLRDIFLKYKNSIKPNKVVLEYQPKDTLTWRGGYILR